MRILNQFTLNDTDTSGQTSSVGEPSIAGIGQNILVTGNWYASRSSDGGNNWNPVDPFNFFPSADDGFCCDQTLHNDPARDLTFWLLQYGQKDGRNTLRVAVNNTTTLDDTGWYWWDLVPDQIDAQWQDQWFDYNHAALSDNFLYVVSNVFSTPGDQFIRSVVFRFPLDDLTSSDGNPGVEFFETDEFSVRCSQGATDVMYFACHIDGGQIRLFEWPESDQTASFVDITVGPWVGGGGGYSAPGPDGNNWLRRADPRITGGWVSDNIIGFMWSANRSSSRPFPYVRVVRIDANTKQIVDEPDIWNPSFAYAYPEACPNSNGEVGITLFRGGSNIHPGHVVGMWDGAAGSWTLQGNIDGTNGPADRKWGDYITCRKHPTDPTGWLAVGFTLQGGNTRDDIQPCVAHFAP
jgi:hypothetical protein